MRCEPGTTLLSTRSRVTSCALEIWTDTPQLNVTGLDAARVRLTAVPVIGCQLPSLVLFHTRLLGDATKVGRTTEPAGRAWRPLGAGRALRALRAGRAGVALQALRAGRAGVALGALSAGHAGVAFGALSAQRADVALGALSAGRAGVALRTRDALR